MSKNKNLFKIPKKDVKLDLPSIKSNIFEPNLFHQADLLYLPTSQFGYKYALTVVDVYNNILDAVALKNKTEKTIVNALETVYNKNKILGKPITLQMDSGTEFKNKTVKLFLNEQKIRPKYTLVNRHRQNANVENANYRLGKLILETQALKELETGKQSKAWHKNLNDYVKMLNDNVRSSKKVYYADGDVIGNDLLIEMLDLGTEVRKVLDYPISAHNKTRTDSKFRVGDIRFSPETYKIMHVILNPNTPILYMLNVKNHPNKIDTSVAYTRNQLQLI